MNKSILTLYGLGYTPCSASTASFIAALLYFLIASRLDYPLLLNLTLFFSVLVISIWAISKCPAYCINDPKEVIVDEFLGMHIALMLSCSKDIAVVACLFAVFRTLDILKPPPFNYIEKKLNGPTGLLWDDIVIGVCIGMAAFGVERLPIFHT